MTLLYLSVPCSHGGFYYWPLDKPTKCILLWSVSDLRPLDLYLLVAKLQIVTATAPRPVLVQLVGTGTAGTAAGGQLTVPTSAGNEAGHTSCGQRVDKGHFRGSWGEREEEG